MDVREQASGFGPQASGLGSGLSGQANHEREPRTWNPEPRPSPLTHLRWVCDDVRVTEVIRVDPASPDEDSIARAAAYIRNGRLVAFPTETVYGLGAHALDRDAVRRIFAAKGRPSTDPLIVHVPSFDALAPLTRNLPPLAAVLARRFWPGPLTMVLPKSALVPDEVTAGLDTVAVRVPAHPVARALILAAGVPVAAPSANLFSRPSPTSAAHVLDNLDGRIDAIIDGGTTTLGVESTVIDLSGPMPTVLRPGAITLAALARSHRVWLAGDHSAASATPPHRRLGCWRSTTRRGHR